MPRIYTAYLLHIYYISTTISLAPKNSYIPFYKKSVDNETLTFPSKRVAYRYGIAPRPNCDVYRRLPERDRSGGFRSPIYLGHIWTYISLALIISRNLFPSFFFLFRLRLTAPAIISTS